MEIYMTFLTSVLSKWRQGLVILAVIVVWLSAFLTWA